MEDAPRSSFCKRTELGYTRYEVRNVAAVTFADSLSDADIETHSSGVSAYYAAVLQFQAGKLDGARRLVQDALKLDPGSALFNETARFLGREESGSPQLTRPLFLVRSAIRNTDGALGECLTEVLHIACREISLHTQQLPRLVALGGADVVALAVDAEFLTGIRSICVVDPDENLLQDAVSELAKKGGGKLQTSVSKIHCPLEEYRYDPKTSPRPDGTVSKMVRHISGTGHRIRSGSLCNIPTEVHSLDTLSNTLIVAAFSLARIARPARASLLQSARALRRGLVLIEFDAPERKPGLPACAPENATATMDQFERGLHVLGFDAHEDVKASNIVSWMLHRKLSDNGEQDEQHVGAWRAELEDAGFSVQVISEPRIFSGCWAPVFALLAL